MTPKSIIALIAFFFGVIILIVINPLVIISAGERGVVLTWGAVEDKILSEGIHWVTPIAQDVEKLDVKTQKEEVEVSAASKDLQNVSSKIALNYHLQEDKVNQLWQKIGKDYKSRIIDPAIQESMKAITAKYTAEELITKREQVKEEAKANLRERLATEYINVDELSIVNFSFSPEFDKAIESKVRAEQDALAQKNVLEQRKYEAEQVVVAAKAEAEAIRIKAAAITQQGGKDYVDLQRINKWNGQGCVSYCGLEASTGLLVTGK